MRVIKEGPLLGTSEKDVNRWCYVMNAPCPHKDFRRRLDTPRAPDPVYDIICPDCKVADAQADEEHNYDRILEEEDNILGDR